MRSGILIVALAVALAPALPAAGGTAATARCAPHHRCRKPRAKPKARPKPQSKAPAPVPSVPWKAGAYSGTTSQQAPIILQLGVAAGTASLSVSDWLGESCGGDNILTVQNALPAVTVQADGSFDIESDGVSVRGRFDAPDHVTGTIHAQKAVSNGSCSVDGLTFAAQYAGATVATPPTPAAGRYAGLTSQNEQILVDVSGAYVTGITWNADMDCSDPNLIAWYDNALVGGTWILGSTFVDTYTWTGSDGSSSTITVSGTFDAGGGASGTMQVQSTSGGATCSTGAVRWSAHLQ